MSAQCFAALIADFLSFLSRRNFICIHFLESETRTGLSWLRQEEQTVLAATHPRTVLIGPFFLLFLPVHAASLPATASAVSDSCAAGLKDARLFFYGLHR